MGRRPRAVVAGGRGQPARCRAGAAGGGARHAGPRRGPGRHPDLGDGAARRSRLQRLLGQQDGAAAAVRQLRRGRRRPGVGRGRRGTGRGAYRDDRRHAGDVGPHRVVRAGAGRAAGRHAGRRRAGRPARPVRPCRRGRPARARCATGGRARSPPARAGAVRGRTTRWAESAGPGVSVQSTTSAGSGGTRRRRQAGSLSERALSVDTGADDAPERCQRLRVTAALDRGLAGPAPQPTVQRLRGAGNLGDGVGRAPVVHLE